jgi:hypothetical protein
MKQNMERPARWCTFYEETPRSIVFHLQLLCEFVHVLSRTMAKYGMANSGMLSALLQGALRHMQRQVTS